ncbi:hypothetical protein [Rhodospirillum sp. A1_3_36]|uniref:hypothetical protein n=1 Tax=Rhodospirillum sp. A1_3_36 TaxID=3391666 RepID=UPI0039A4693F
MEGCGGIAATRRRSNANRYSVGVYNAMVRALLRDCGGVLDGEDEASAQLDGDLGSHWAELQHEEVVAESAEQARRLASRLYPSADGFVITEVRAVEVAA